MEDRILTEEIDKMSPDFPMIIGTSGPVGKTRIPGQVFRENSDGTREHLAGPMLGMIPDPVDISKFDDMLADEAHYHAYVAHGSHLATMTNTYATNLVEAAMPGWKE
ncbi:MAG: hypothetical protein GTO60_02175, partial [Gammaproteobacteria bacterium]|nr:hypothetical protein [Gammaproteobacteria bacterium]